MPNPRARIDDDGEPKVCIIKIPIHLSKFLYRATLRARQGQGVHIEETDLVISLIATWAETQPPLDDWPTVLAALQAEAKKPESGKGKKSKSKK